MRIQVAEALQPAITAISAPRSRVSVGSARSLLLTVLGEFVLPSGQAVWTSALLHALVGVGTAENSARQAIARSAAAGDDDSRSAAAWDYDAGRSTSGNHDAWSAAGRDCSDRCAAESRAV